MIRRILVLTVATAALSAASSVSAQEATPPQQTQPPATAQTTQSFMPGAPVVGADGVSLGVVDQVHEGASGAAMLHVRAPDGTVKAVPTDGATVQGATVAVAWTEAEFEAAPAASAPMEPAVPPVDSATPPAPMPTPDPMADPSTDEPDEDGAAVPPTEPQA